MKRVILSTLLVAALLPVALSVHAQIVEKMWQPLGDFPNGIRCVYFMDLAGPPRIGFVGTSGAVFRTSDGGATWVPASTDATDFLPSDFTFKDSLTGWFSNFGISNSKLFKTTDGGLTWKSLTMPAYQPTSIYYNPKHGLLLLSSWTSGLSTGGSIWKSRDDGATWQLAMPNDRNLINGFSFFNGDIGVAGMIESFAYYTTDGGESWQMGDGVSSESWQPLADSLRGVAWYASELGPDLPLGRSLVLRSVDHAKTFVTRIPVELVTGTIREGSCASLYLQNTYLDNTGGVMRSTDGQTWSQLVDQNNNGGPVDSVDKRFYVKGSYVFAGGKVRGDNTTRLWRYVEDTLAFGGQPFVAPQVSTKDFHISTRSCTDLDSSLTVNYINDCLPGVLESATLASTSRFALRLSEPLPQEVRGSFPIRIEHRPQDRIPDTTQLYLHYLANGKDFYDTVLVTGSIDDANVISPFEVLANGRNDVVVHGGDSVFIALRSQDALSATSGLDSVEFSAIYERDVLSFLATDIPPPFSLLHEAHGEGTEDVAIRIPSGTSLDSGTVITRVVYRANVSPTASARYLLTSLLLNGQPFQGCAGSASVPQPATITVAGCADTLYISSMMGVPIVQLLGIERDGEQYYVSVQSGFAQSLPVEIYNVIGQLVNRTTVSLAAKSEQHIPLDVPGGGVYFVRVGRASARFVVAP